MARHFKQQKQVVYSKAKERQSDAEKEVITATGRVLELLPNAEFGVELLDAHFAGHRVRAKGSGRMRMNNIKIIMGDYVALELNPYDLTRARITFRYREKPDLSAPANDNSAS